MREEEDREARTKHQKTAADAMRAELKKKMVLDAPNESKAVGEGFGFALPSGWDVEEDWEDMEDDEELIITPVAPPPPVALDSNDTTASLFPPTKPFTFPNSDSLFSSSVDASSSPRPVVPPSPSIAANADLTPVDPASSSTFAPTLSPPPLAADKPFSSLHVALPLPPGAVPKPALRSAAVILSGKKRKTRNLDLKRAPELYDYLPEQDEEEWEDVEEEGKVPKRPKDGRAVDGRLPSAAESTGEAEEEKEQAGVEEATGGDEPMKEKDDDSPEAKKRRREERELLPSAKAHKEKLVPKSYQTALIERAKEGNIVTVMGTGTGKTLVAVRLYFLS